MALDRGKLAKIDRRALSELDHREGVQLVKVPLSRAAWSTWRRYCQALGITMGAGISGLIAHELGALVDEGEYRGAVFAAESLQQQLARSEVLDVRERRLDQREKSLKARERLLRARTRPLDAAGAQTSVEMIPARATQASSTNGSTATDLMPRVSYGCVRDCAGSRTPVGCAKSRGAKGVMRAGSFVEDCDGSRFRVLPDPPSRPYADLGSAPLPTASRSPNTAQYRTFRQVPYEGT